MAPLLFGPPILAAGLLMLFAPIGNPGLRGGVALFGFLVTLRLGSEMLPKLHPRPLTSTNPKEEALWWLANPAVDTILCEPTSKDSAEIAARLDLPTDVTELFSRYSQIIWFSDRAPMHWSIHLVGDSKWVPGMIRIGHSRAGSEGVVDPATGAYYEVARPTQKLRKAEGNPSIFDFIVCACRLDYDHLDYKPTLDVPAKP